MKKKEEKVGFDLSVLKLNELIDVYQNITEFLQYLDDNKIEEEKGKNEDE